MTTESIKAKIANNETINQEEVDYLLEADIDALLDYEHVARLAEATGKTQQEIRAEIANA